MYEVVPGHRICLERILAEASLDALRAVALACAKRHAEDVLEWRPGVEDGPLANRLATPSGMLTLRDPED